MNKVIEDALRATLLFIGQSVQFLVGLAAVIAVTALSLSGELISDLTAYSADKIDWSHVAAADGPAMALAIAAYIKHKQMVADALATPPPAPKAEGS